jgi:hypothetical protein
MPGELDEWQLCGLLDELPLEKAIIKELRGVAAYVDVLALVR